MANKSDPFPNLPRRMMFAWKGAEVRGEGVFPRDAGVSSDAVQLKWADGTQVFANQLKVGQVIDVSPDGTVRTKRDRKAYMREYMAKKRAKAKT